jgi:hypothetical protein
MILGCAGSGLVWFPPVSPGLALTFLEEPIRKNEKWNRIETLNGTGWRKPSAKSKTSAD